MQPQSYGDAPAGIGNPKGKKWGKKAPTGATHLLRSRQHPRLKEGPTPGCWALWGNWEAQLGPAVCVWGGDEPGAQLGLIPQMGLGLGLPFAR